MKEKKTILTIITGALTSVAPIFFSVCKGGACLGVCVSPVASLFGISSASIAALPIVNAIEHLIIAISAVSFTISYYSLYVLPKYKSICGTGDKYECAPSDNQKRKVKLTKIIFWLGLVLSIGFLSYFEYQKYQAANVPICSTENCIPAETGTCSDSTKCQGGSCEQ